MYHIVPRTWWSGEHRRVETIEILKDVSEGIGGDGHEPERPIPSAQMTEVSVEQVGGDGREKARERVGERETRRVGEREMG